MSAPVFIKLTRIVTFVPIWVNASIIQTISTNGSGSQIIFAAHEGTLLVTESPSQILACIPAA
tara:strand:- start:52 stop:240 length:189 start_codon:yes stop_codon:yes gene_type:complete